MISTLLSLWTVSMNFTFFSFLADFLGSSHYFYKYFVTIFALKFLNSVCFSFCESPVENFQTKCRFCIN